MAKKIYTTHEFLDILDCKIQEYESEIDSVTSTEDALVYLRDFAADVLNITTVYIFTYNHFGDGQNDPNYNEALDNTLIIGPMRVKNQFLWENVDELNKLVDEADRVPPGSKSEGDIAWLWHQLFSSRNHYLNDLSPSYYDDIDTFIVALLPILDLV